MVYIMGDIHGSLAPVTELFTRFHPTADDIIVLLGDVAVNYTGGLRDVQLKHGLNYLKSTFFCIHGNHENRPQNIDTYREKQWHGGRVLFEDEYPNILFPLDGDIFELEGRQCLVIGGAYSVDKAYRCEGHNWWPDEQPSPETRAYVEQQVQQHRVDVIFSHTCPAKYIPTECFLPSIDQSTVDHSTEEWLDKIEEMTDCQAWYLGHWHINKRIDRLHFLMHDVETLI